MKYYLIAGEASGDLYGSLLMREIKLSDSSAQFKFWGGKEMQKMSEGQLMSIDKTSFMGFWEVAKNIKTIKRFFHLAKNSIEEFSPDIIIFIDYPGFNLRMATWAKDKGYNTAFYISPQLWAWKANRHKILRDKIDLFFVILPFEKNFYENLDTPCIYVGHPLLELISKQDENEIPTDTKIIGLFPGSRKQEIQKHLPILIDYANQHSEYRFIIAGMKHIGKPLYVRFLKDTASHIDIEYDNTYGIMEKIDFAISSSGTATLELALFLVPQIVIYKTSRLSYMIGKHLVKLDNISLVNLIANKDVIPELIQNAFNTKSLNTMMVEKVKLNSRKETVENYKKLRVQLGKGNSSKIVAEEITNFLSAQSG